MYSFFKSNHTEFIVCQHAGPYRSQMVPGTIIFSGGRHFITSSELKAQVSFSDRLSSVRLAVLLSVNFTFSSSSPELVGQFQSNLAESSLR